MAMFKMNYFHWHLTDDHLWTIEIKKYPRLAELALYAGNADGSIHRGFYITGTNQRSRCLRSRAVHYRYPRSRTSRTMHLPL